MSVTVTSSPNIALIKYWGNRNDDLRLPAADSLSMTLSNPVVEVAMNFADTFAVQSFLPDGSEKKLTRWQTERLEKQYQLTQLYLRHLDIPEALHQPVMLTIHSHIPEGIGLASSAATFSALAKGYAALIRKKFVLTDEQISVAARLGSGSAARSIFGGFSALVAGEGDDIDASYAKQIADENHWQLHDIVIAPTIGHKKVGSTEGHAIAHTSPHFADRIATIPKRMKECKDAILNRDFEKLQKVSEEDALDMHNVMATSMPPLNYLNDETHRIIKEIIALRKERHLPVLYTMDAGPTVHLICTEEAKATVGLFARDQKECSIFEAAVGTGSKLIG